MNENDPTTKNSVKPPEAPKKFIMGVDEYYYYEDPGNWDSEIVDQCETCYIPITSPESGVVVEGSLSRVSCQEDPHYAIIVRSPDHEHVAVRTDAILVGIPPAYFQARPVALDGSAQANAWEMFRWNESAGWELIPGQHLKPKIATAQQWLREIRLQIFPSLDLQATELLAERFKLQAGRQTVNPKGEKELSQASAASMARAEWLGPDYKKFCRARQAAEHRCSKVGLALLRHATSAEQTHPLWSAIGRWLAHNRKGRRLQTLAKRAQTWRQRVVGECSAFEAGANTETAQAWIGERTQEMLKADRDIVIQLNSLEAQKEALATQMSEASKLTQLLEQQSPDTLITMDQSQVPERRLRTVPVPHEDSFPKQQINASNRMRP